MSLYLCLSFFHCFSHLKACFHFINLFVMHKNNCCMSFSISVLIYIIFDAFMSKCKLFSFTHKFFLSFFLSFLLFFFLFLLRPHYLFQHPILQMTFSTWPNAQISSNVVMENVTHSTSTVMANVTVMTVRMKRFASEPEGISEMVMNFLSSSVVICSVGLGSI